MAKKLTDAVLMLLLLGFSITAFNSMFFDFDTNQGVTDGITSDLSELDDNTSYAVRNDLESNVVGKIDVSGNFEPEGDNEYSATIGDANAAANIKTKNIISNFMTLISQKLNIPSYFSWLVVGFVSIMIVFMLARTILGDTRI